MFSFLYNDLRIAIKQYLIDEDIDKCRNKLQELKEQHDVRQKYNNVMVLLYTIAQCFQEHYCKEPTPKIGRVLINAILRDDWLYYHKLTQIELRESDHDTLYHELRQLFKNVIEYYAEPWCIKDCVSALNKKIKYRETQEKINQSSENDWLTLTFDPIKEYTVSE